ncbi:hypothetical protein BCV72DRAFT_208249 [Rhizopus microsporus var. microsporus]|nr:hypothetical protein BCV72DRAFT_208249 [Rhizopus microsporus var. microsporus]
MEHSCSLIRFNERVRGSPPVYHLCFVIKTSLANACRYPKFVTLIQEVVDHTTQLIYAGSIFANYYFLELLENGEELPMVTQNLFYNIFSIFAGQGKHASDSIKKSFKTFRESTFLIQCDLDKYANKGYMTTVSSVADVFLIHLQARTV